MGIHVNHVIVSMVIAGMGNPAPGNVNPIPAPMVGQAQIAMYVPTPGMVNNATTVNPTSMVPIARNNVTVWIMRYVIMGLMAMAPAHAKIQR